MLYPRSLSYYGYCKELIQRYIKEYSLVLTDEIIKNTINYIVDKIGSVIEQNKENLSVTVIDSLSSLKDLTQDQYMTLLKEIKPSESLSFLFWSSHEPAKIISFIENRRKILVPLESKDKYSEFISKATLNCAKELADCNKPKSNLKKRTTFNDQVESVAEEDREADLQQKKHKI